jgi:Family of unknown function (DUF5759)
MVLSASEAQQLVTNRHRIKKEIYKTIMERFDRQIRNAISIGHSSARLEIPPFIFGFPLYDLSKATRYLMRQVQNLGYYTELQGEYTIRVSWSAPSKVIVTEPNEEFPTLINLRKIASKIKNTNKKNGGSR